MSLTQAQKQDAYRFFALVFNAAPGVTYMNQIADAYAAGATTKDIVNAYTTKPQFLAVYPNFFTNEQFASKLVESVVGNTASEAAKDQAKADIVAALNSGLSRGDVIYTVFNNLANKPKTDADWGQTAKMFANKVAVAQYVTEEKLFDSTNLSTLQSFLANVTPSTDTSSNAAIEAALASSPLNQGQTFMLTTGADNIVGTGGNDTINGYVNVAGTGSTLTGADQINGGAGTGDSLNVTFENSSAVFNFPGATISNVEVVNLRNIASHQLTLDANFVPGATEVWADRATAAVNITNLATGATAGMRGDGIITNGNLSFGYATASADATLAIAGGTKAGNVTISSAPAKVTVSSSGAANTIGTVALGSSATELVVNAATNLTTGNITGFTGTSAKITVSGAASKVNLATIENATVKTIDASGLTAGGLTATLSTNTGIQVKGGKGNDVLTTGAAIIGTAYVDAGDGSGDTLVVANSTHVTSGNGSLYKGFEVLQVENSVSVDLDHLSANNSIGAVIINQGAGNTGVTNMTAAQAANVTVKGSGAGVVTFGVKNASNPGQIDTLKITVDNGTAGAQAVTLTGPTMAGVEKLEVTNNENLTITTLANATALDNVKFSGAGNVVITSTGAVDFAANTIFDFSAVTGTVSFDASAAQSGATATGLLIKGSSTKANTISDSQKADVIILGSGDDTVTFTGGSDNVTLGAGADTFNFNSKVGSNNMGTAGLTFVFASTDSVADKDAGSGLSKGISATKTDTITGFDVATFAAAAGAKFTIDTDKSATSVDVVTSAVNFGTTTVSAANGFLVVNDTANTAAYVFQDTNGNSIIDNGEFAVKLVGTGALAAGEFSVVSGNLVFTSV